MNGFISFTLALVLVLLTLFSQGQALECYQCSYTSDGCQTKKTCSAADNSCMKLSDKSSGKTLYDCRVYDRCSVEAVKEDFKLTNFNVNCCQKDLCNRSPLALPLTALVLSLSSALVMVFSW